jgi:2,3-bisphosphoglycerate-dependent phosphoglycerate mutase
LRFRILLILLIGCLTACTTAPASKDNYTLYLVRHAEKQADGSRDPELTEAGTQRSENLARWFEDKDIRDIWSSDYKRTRDTAKPTLSKLGLKLKIYDAHDLSALSETLLSNQNSALIVGHSNTTPELARLLCDCDIDDMDDSEYDRLIVVSFDNSGAQVRTLIQSNLPQQ